MNIYIPFGLRIAFRSLLSDAHHVGISSRITGFHDYWNIEEFKDSLFKEGNRNELKVIVTEVVPTPSPDDSYYTVSKQDLDELTLIPVEARWAYLLEIGKPHD